MTNKLSACECASLRLEALAEQYSFDAALAKNERKRYIGMVQAFVIAKRIICEEVAREKRNK